MNTAPTCTPRFTDPHIKVLQDRAIPLEVAYLAGLRSVDASEAGRLLGWATPAVPGLAIPYFTVPGYVRLRTDTGSPRYLCPKGREVPVYVPPGIRTLDAPDTEHAEEALVVVEAPLKALCLAAIGSHAVGLGGVATTLRSDGRLNDSWHRVELDDRLVIICFDTNRQSNPAVAQAEARLAIALQQEGARVRVADLPKIKGYPGAGPDDFIKINGAQALLDILASAVPANPLDRLDVLVAATDHEGAERLLEDNPFLASVLEGGERVRTVAARRLDRLGVGKRSFDRALSVFAKTLKRKETSQEDDEDASDAPYTREDGCFVSRCGKSRGPICNFTAEIVEDVNVDDGAEKAREFLIEGVNKDGEKLPRITVPAREFASSSAIWCTAGWGSRAIVYADCMQHIHPAIQLFSKPVCKTVLAHTGWTRVDGQLVYLTSNGAIGLQRNTEVTVRLDSTLTRYALPEQSAPTEQVVHAVRTSLRLLHVVADRISIPLLAATYRAPLNEFLPCDAVIWPYGPTGSLKSTIAAILVQHFGTEFDRERLTASWLDTATSLEFKLFRAKDVLVVIDDFAPRGVEDRDELRRKAAQVIRNVGNGSSRGRMHADLTARVDRPPRALVMGTGEDMPSGESIVARTFPIGMRREDVNLTELTAMQRDARVLPIAMRAYIEHIAQLVTGNPEFAAFMRGRFEDLRQQFSGHGHLRSPSAATHLALGWRCFVRFAEKIGAVNGGEAESLIRRGDIALREQLEMQAASSREEDAVRRFLRWLRSLIDGGRVKLVGEAEQITSLPGSDTVGWQTSDGKIHLLPDLAYAAVARAMRESGRGVTIKDTTLWGRLEVLGYVTPYDKGRQTVKRTHDGQRHRVVELLPHALELGDDGGPEPDGGGGAPPSPASGAPQGAPDATSGAGPAGESAPGALQRAVTHQESGESPDRPAPAGEGASIDQQLCAQPGEPRAQTCSAQASPPPGASGAEEEGGREKSLSDCGLPPAPLRPAAGGSVGAAGAPLGQGAYELVTNAGRLPELACAVEASGVVALDLETTGLDPLKDRPRLLQIALPDGRIFVVDLFATQTIGPLAPALGHVDVVGHNLAFDLGFLSRHAVVAASKTFDTMLASQIVDAGVNLHAKGHHSLASVLSRVLGVTVDKAEQKSDWSGSLAASQLEYAARDVLHLLPLRDALAKRLVDRSLVETTRIESDLLPVIVDVQLAGVPVDVVALDTLAVVKEREAAEAYERLRQTLAIDNPRSTKQLLPALRAAGLNVNETNAEALAPYRDHPAVRDLAAMRTGGKIADDARGLALAARGQADGRVRARLHQIGAPTGRMATSDPNLLGLPKDKAMRACIAAPAGRTLVVADYAAIELRVLAHITKDKRLASIFQANGDPHRALAAILLRKEPAAVTGDERKRAKPVNFGFAFGMGARRFVGYALKDYGVTFTEAEAGRFRAAYLRAYREVDTWQKKTRATMHLEVRTCAGRVRSFSNRKDGYTERLNMPVQGTAADGMKRAMALLAPRLARLDARIVLAVHDELVVEVPEQAAEEAKRVVNDGMVEGMAVDVSSVPIVVEAEVRRTWGKT